MLSDVYDGIVSSQGDELLNPCCSKLIQCSKDILLASSFSQEMEDKGKNITLHFM